MKQQNISILAPCVVERFKPEEVKLGIAYVGTGDYSLDGSQPRLNALRILQPSDSMTRALASLYAMFLAKEPYTNYLNAEGIIKDHARHYLVVNRSSPYNVFGCFAVDHLEDKRVLKRLVIARKHRRKNIALRIVKNVLRGIYPRRLVVFVKNENNSFRKLIDEALSNRIYSREDKGNAIRFELVNARRRDSSNRSITVGNEPIRFAFNNYRRSLAASEEARREAGDAAIE